MVAGSMYCPAVVENVTGRAERPGVQAVTPVNGGLTPVDRGLTPREREILQLIVAGQTNRQMAECLVVSPETVKTHVRHVLGKLGVSRKAELRVLLAAARYQ